MTSNERNLEVEFTEECIEEMLEIYEYISYNLKESKIAKRLISEIMNKILNLSNAPKKKKKIGKVDKLQREYRRIVIKNYIVLYTIDYEKNKIYVSRIIYGKRNYLN